MEELITALTCVNLLVIVNFYFPDLTVTLVSLQLLVHTRNQIYSDYVEFLIKSMMPLISIMVLRFNFLRQYLPIVQICYALSTCIVIGTI